MSVNRRRADLLVGILIVAVILLGGWLSWDAYRQQQALGDLMGSMMGGADMGVHGPNASSYVLGTVLVAAIILGFYAMIRPDLKRGGGESEVTNRVPDSAGTGTDESATNPNQSVRPDVLEVLPDDEHRILEPVIDSPGITQIALRDRSDFSKSKVSQTVSDLEKRGLLYRERQGRTYRVYHSDELS